MSHPLSRETFTEIQLTDILIQTQALVARARALNYYSASARGVKEDRHQELSVIERKLQDLQGSL